MKYDMVSIASSYISARYTHFRRFVSSEGRYRVRRRLVGKHQRARQRQLEPRQELRQKHRRQAGHRRGQGARRHGRVRQRRVRAVLSQLALQHPRHHRGYR